MQVCEFCLCACLSLLCVSVFIKSVSTAYCQAVGWCVCMCVTDWCVSWQYVSLWSLRGLTVSTASSLSCSDSTVSPRTDCNHHVKKVHGRLHQYVMQSLRHRMESVKVFQQSAGAYIIVIKAYINEGMDAVWTYFFPIITFCVIYFVHKEFPYDG